MTRRRLVMAAAVLLGGAVLAVGWRGRAVRPNVLLITVDTLRADALRCYGQPQPTSPYIDALAARGVLFERAVAASGYTGPSHASIMTSRYPRRHSMGFSNAAVPLAGGETLAEAFRDAGYDTAAFVSNFVLRSGRGFERGFAVYDDDMDTREQSRPVFERLAPDTLARVLDWLQRPRQQPFFLWVHFQDPHGPYTPPASYREAFRAAAAPDEPELPVCADNSGLGGIPPYQLVEGRRQASDYRARYAGEVAFMDEAVGALLRAVEARGPAVVALTSDHGESFGENDFHFAHGHSAMPDLSHVPLILSAPGLRPERRADLVSHVDIMPTLLQLAGEPLPPGLEGVALAPPLRDGAPLPPRPVFCDIGYELAVHRPGAILLAATPQPKTWALETDYQMGRAAAKKRIAGAADLTARRTFAWDGGPTWSSRGDDPVLAQDLARYLADGGAPATGEPVTASPADRERLRSLGYGDQ